MMETDTHGLSAQETRLVPNQTRSYRTVAGSYGPVNEFPATSSDMSVERRENSTLVMGAS